MKKIKFLESNTKLLNYLHKNKIQYKVIRTIEELFIEIDLKSITDKQLYQIKKLNRKL